MSLRRAPERLRAWMSRVRAPVRTVVLAAADDVQRLPPEGRLAVHLSSSLARCTVLPWSAELSGEAEWSAYASHVFSTIHGPAAARWRIRVSDAGRGRARVACAVEGDLLDRLLAQARVVSVQPRLMAEFNSRRGQFDREAGWLVLPEGERATLALIENGAWRTVRSRRVRGDLRKALPELLAREAALSGFPACERCVIAEAA